MFMYLVSCTAEHRGYHLQFLSMPFPTLHAKKSCFFYLLCSQALLFPWLSAFVVQVLSNIYPLFSASHGRSLSFSPGEFLHLAELWAQLWVWHGLLGHFIKEFKFFFQWAFAAKGIAPLGWFFLHIDA